MRKRFLKMVVMMSLLSCIQRMRSWENSLAQVLFSYHIQGCQWWFDFIQRKFKWDQIDWVKRKGCTYRNEPLLPNPGANEELSCCLILNVSSSKNLRQSSGNKSCFEWNFTLNIIFIGALFLHLQTLPFASGWCRNGFQVYTVEIISPKWKDAMWDTSKWEMPMFTCEERNHKFFRSLIF